MEKSLNMNRYLSAALVSLFVLAGCVQGDAPILLGNFKPFEDPLACLPDLTPENAVSSGRLDVAGGGFFVQPLNVVSQLGEVEQPGTIEDTASPRPNEAIIDRVRLSYQTDTGLSIPDQEYPMYFVISPGSDDNFMGINFFPAGAREVITGVLPGETVTVFATVQLAGNLRSGAAFTSSEATFPIHLSRSQGACPAGQAPALNGVCGNPGGQAGTPVICCPEDNLNCHLTPEQR